MTANWEDVLSAIEQKVPPTTFNRWFRHLTPERFTSCELRLVADDEFDAVFIEKNFAELIRLHLHRIAGRDVKLKIVHGVAGCAHAPGNPTPKRKNGAGPPLSAKASPPPANGASPPLNGHPPPPSEGVSGAAGAAKHNGSASPKPHPSPHSGPEEEIDLKPSDCALTERFITAGLKLQYSFDDFVVGSSNEFAHAACTAVYSSPGLVYNPLFIYGNVGLGKTHLLNAIGIEMLRCDASRHVLYMTAEAFMNEMIEHIKAQDMTAFRNRFRNRLDVLLLDDVQFLAGKESTQQEFFHTFNALHQTGAQIVLTSDCYPHEIPHLEERLRSRFQWGLVADIQKPAIETRLAILQRKAENLELKLSEDVALFLAQNIHSNVRELEGALLRLHAFVGFNQKLLTLNLARSLLHQFLKENSRQLTVESILQVVSNYHNVKTSELKGKSRKRAVSRPRQLAMYLAKKHTGLSYPQLGKKFGGRDHTTVLAACKRIMLLLESDQPLAATMHNLERQLLG